VSSADDTKSRSDDRLVADYLARLAAAAARLPADRRAELIEEISLHIAEARAVLPTARGMLSPTGAGPGSAAAAGASSAVSEVLERLGRPEDIVRAAAEDAAAEDAETEAMPLTSAPGTYAPGTHVGRKRAFDIGTVVLLLVGGLLIGFGWVVGVFMLWVSPRWRTSDKLLGTLVWPGGLAAELAVLRFGVDLPPVLVLNLLLIGIAGPILVAIRLLRQASRARSTPAYPPANHHPLLPVSR
jgi:hypothetical protein